MTWPVKATITQNFGDNATANIRPGSPDYWIIQQFGNYQPDGHTGIDFGVPSGTEVSAVADGVVLHSGWLTGTYASNPWWIAPSFAGNCIVIDHGHFIGIYGHLSKNIVPRGARVHEGDGIALSGNTGASTGAHLHFEVLPDGYDLNARFYGRVNPLPYLGSASVGPAGDITTEQPETQEDELSEAVDRIIAEIRNIAAPGESGKRTAGPLYDLVQNVETINAALLPGEAGVRHAGAVYAALAALDPAQIAAAVSAAVPAETAKQVAALLGGK